jgi:hypothetical protein
VATAEVRTLHVINGRRSHAGRGAVIGGVAGAALGLVLGIAAAAEECTGFCVVEVGPEEVVGVTVFLGAVGAGFGALIGSASRGDRWVAVPRPWSVPPAGP